MKIRANSGFTLIELLIAIALGLVILAGLYQTFRTQHDSYIIQDQVAAMQQNLRASMYLISRDLQMAGYYTNFDRNNHNIDWDDRDGDSNPLTNPENGRALLFAVNNNAAPGDDIKDGTDMLVIVKAGNEHRTLTGGETASGTSVTLSSFDLDGDGTADLNNTAKRYGLLVKNDLRAADLFIVDTTSGSITNPWNLGDNYLTGDSVYRTDIVIYKIDEDTGHPCLRRKNLGSDNGDQVVAEDIDNLQVRYQLSDGSWVNTLAPANQNRVRAVEVFLVGRTAHIQRGYQDTNTYSFADNPAALQNPNDHYRRKVISTIVKTRNVGL